MGSEMSPRAGFGSIPSSLILTALYFSGSTRHSRLPRISGKWGELRLTVPRWAMGLVG
jgi:hypothetical protein